MSSSVDRFLQRSGSVDAPQPALPFTLEHAPDPNLAARILKAQQATGLSGDIVARQLEQIEAAEQAKQLQQHQLAPVTKAFVAEDPNQAAIAQKEAPQLSYLERHIRHAAQEFSGGRATTRLTDIGTAAMLGRASEEQRAEQAAIEAELGNHVDYGIGQGLRPTMFSRGPEGDAMYDAVKRSSPAFGAIATALELLEQVPGAVANQVPIMASTFKGKAIGAGVGFAGGAAVGAVTGPGALATGTAGAGLGWRLGGVPAAAQMEAATAYLDYEKLRDDQGRPLDRRTILGAALVTGAVNGALEGLSLDKLTKSIPGIRTLGRKGMRELLAKQTTRMAVEHALKELGESALTEGTTEFLQEYVTNLSGRIVQLAQGDKQLSVGELLEQTVGDPEFFKGALEAGKGGLLAAVGGSALGGATSIATKAVQIRRAERQADVFRVLAEGAANSELRATLPEKHRELVDRMTKHGPLESVYVPAERFTEYFQGAGLDPADVATELLGSREKYDEAQRSGGLLEIPTSTYATMLAGTDHHKGLVEDLSFSPTELSMREAKQQAAELDAELEARQKMDRGGLEAAEQVTDHVTDQLRRAGFNEKTARTYAAALYGAPMRTLAARLGTGVTADELLSRFNLRISRPGTEGAPQLPAVDVDRLRRAHEATRAAALERAGKVLEEGEERFMAPRAPGGARRPVERVSTKGLLAELLDLEEKRADAESRSVYELREDENMHTSGIPQMAATRKGVAKGGPSRQAKALTNLDDYKRITDQVYGELQRRGLDERGIVDAVEDLRAELDERAAQAGDYDALGRGEKITDEAGNVLFQPAPPIESEAFRRWFGDSKVVDEDGNPLVVFHGTTRQFDRFDRNKAGIESDQGAGFYFTNTLEDVEANYAHVEGPDLKNKIDRRAEQIEVDMKDQIEAYAQALEADPELERNPEWDRILELAQVDENGSRYRSPYEEAIRELSTQRATAELTEHAGATMPVFLAIENPVIIGGRDETTLTFSEEFDEEGDPVGEPEGTLLTFLDELDRVASRYYDVDAAALDQLRSELMMATADSGGELGIREIQDMVNTALQYATDDTGQLANHEIVRQALEGMGFDGIIDHAVNEKFGDARSSGQAMEGMSGATTHYIAFHPWQIKSAISNVGTYSRSSENIHEQSVEEFEQMTRDYSAWYRDQLGQALARGWDPDEQVVAAAIRKANGVIGFGATHYEALNDRLYEDLSERELDELEEGFLTSTGRFIGREEAHAILMGREATAQLIQELAANPQLDYAVLHSGDFGAQDLPGYGGRRSGTIVPGETKPRAHRQRRRTFEQRAYHGSPFRFDAFSLMHMGKGEGAAAFGWGLYFAGVKQLAEYYRSKLTNDRQEFVALDADANAQLPAWVRAGITAGTPAGGGVRGTSATVVDSYIAEFQQRIRENAEEIRRQDEAAARGEFAGNRPDNREGLQRIVDTLERLKAAGEYSTQKAGRVYTVEIPDDEQLLEWDRPLSQQSPRIQAALQSLGIKIGTIKYPTFKQALNLFSGDFAQRGAAEDIGIRQSLATGHSLLMQWGYNTERGNVDDAEQARARFNHWFSQKGKLLSPTRHDDMLGQDAYEELTWKIHRETYDRMRADPNVRSIDLARLDRQELASKALLSVGILGHKYLNGQSRNSGDGAYNFVVYDDAQIAIREYEQRAYHGSPHIFPRFSTDAIGSGEGAQVYGWGLYFAGKKEVGQWYREKLSRGYTVKPGDLLQLPSGETVRSVVRAEFDRLIERYREDPSQFSAEPAHLAEIRAETRIINAVKSLELTDEPLTGNAIADFAIGGLEEQLEADTKYYRQTIQELEARSPDHLLHPSKDQLAAMALNDAHRKVQAAERIFDVAQHIIEQFRSRLGTGTLTRLEQGPVGRLYTVELEPAPHEYLDWDKPLSEQSPFVLEKLGDEVLQPETRLNGMLLGDFFASVGWSTGPSSMWRAALAQELNHGMELEEAIESVKSHLGTNFRSETNRIGEEFFAAVRAAAPTLTRHMVPDDAATGEDFYHDLERRMGDQRAASEWLHEQGIRGIRYLDGVSRGRGEGNHNFVIFDENDVAIREYEQAVDEGLPADPESTLFLEKLLGEHDVGVLVKLAPLLKGNEIARAGTVRQFYDELVQLVAMGAFDEQLGDQDPITSPAVRVGQAMYRGASHERAIADAQAAGSSRAPIEEGFATRGNQFLTRDEARARSQLRVDPHAGVEQLLRSLGIQEIRLGQMPVDMREYEQRAPGQKRTLIVQHNITGENLLHAAEIGGLAMPSVAITHQDQAITGFGEITLLGDQALIDPQKSRRTRVFGADVYSPRYPDVEHTLNYRKLAALSKDLKRFELFDGPLVDDVNQLESRGREQLEHRADVYALFLESRGLELPALPAGGKWDKYYTLRDHVNNALKLTDEFTEFTRQLFNSLDPKQRIRNGWDANGNAKYIAHTLANVLRKMKADGIRGRESAGNLYGAGQVRSHYAPEFRSVSEIRAAAAAGRIISDEQFEAVRKSIDEAFLELGNQLEEFNPERSRDFRWMDVVGGLLEDATTMPLEKALAEWGFDVAAMHEPRGVLPKAWLDARADLRAGGASDEKIEQMAAQFGISRDESMSAIDQIREFQEKLRNLPTEYFEAKYTRAVDPGEFQAAVIPHTTPLRVRELLREKGLRIAEYQMGDQNDRRRVIAETAQQHDLLFQKPADPRGRIRIGNNSIEIELLEKANLSTFIHETGHFYLEVLGTLAGDQDPPAQIRDDYNTLLAWMGVSSRAEIETKHHEQFARAFEAYLLEGESPSEELRGPFARMRTWLVSVYRSIKALRVNLTPDVRQVFDRLFATDEEITAAEARIRAEPLFADVAAAGMSPGLAEYYSRAIADAKLAARDELSSKVMAELTRERKAWWKEERERMHDRVALEVYAEPTSRALAMLQKGTLPDGSPLPEGVAAVKLDKRLLVEAYGPELVKSLPRGLYAKEGGLSADDAAAVFGFGTGGELLQALASSEKIPARINRLTDERMREEHGNMLEDGTLADRAMAAVHNEDRGRVLRLELEHLLSQDLAAAKGMLRKLGRRIPSTEDSREIARATIAAKQIRDIQPQLYQVAEAKAAGLAIDHFTKGDVEGAFAEKLRELHNYELYRAATAAREEADKIVELMRSFDRPAVRARIGKAGGGYLEQIDALRERYSFTRIGEKGLRKREQLRDFAARAAAEGTEIDVPPALLDEAHRQHWKETSLEELEGLRDTVEQLAHLARTKNRLLANEAKRNLEDARTELRAGAAEYFDLERDPVDLTKPLREQLVSTGKGIVADHTRMEFLFQRLDGFKANGPFWTYFFQPFVRAEDLENTMRRNDAEAMKQILSAYTPAERRAWFTKRIDIPGAGTSRVRGTFTKANVLAIALNWGNAYNRAALMEGYGWNESQVERILATLDERDARFVQAIWNHIDTYWPAAEQLEQEITGLAPAKVEASPVTIAGVPLAGGYYPIAFDREQSSRQTALDLAASVSDMAKGYGARAMTRHGHLIERTSTGGKPLLLELSVINQHLAQVTHDLSHRRAVIDASKLIRDPELQATIEASVGREMYQQLGPWLSSIAGDVPTNMVQRLERVASRARMGATAVGLGLNITSSFVQTLGYANSVAELGAEYSAKGLADAYAKPWRIKQTWEFVTSRSSSMRDRLGGFDREVRDMARKPGALGTLGVDPSFMYQLIGWMDMGVSIPTWLGAYRKAMDGKAEGIGAGDERAAIDFADSMVRTTQAAGAAKDLAAVQRGPQWWKLNTAFYSSMSILFNQFARIPQRYAIDKNAPKAIASIVLIWFLPAVMEDILRGRGPQPDDDKLKWVGRKIAFYPLSTVVLLRDFASSLDRSLEYGRLEAPTTAVAQIIESAGKTAKAAIDLASGEELKRAQLREAFNTVGYFAQLPTRQLWKTGEYFHDWWTGTTSPDSPLEAFWGAVTGVPQEDRQR